MYDSRALLLVGWMAVTGAVAGISIEGVTYVDADRDGTFDPGEVPFTPGDTPIDDDDNSGDAGAGLQVSLSCQGLPSGEFFATTAVADPVDGSIALDFEVDPRDLQSSCAFGLDGRDQLEPFRLQATGAVATQLELTADITSVEANIGVAYQDVELSGRVWDDLDGDMLYEPGESEAGIGGVEVEASCVGNGGSETEASGTTEADGSYRLAVLRGDPRSVDCTVSVDPAQPALAGLEATTPTELERDRLRAGDREDGLDFGFRSGP